MVAACRSCGYRSISRMIFSSRDRLMTCLLSVVMYCSEEVLTVDLMNSSGMAWPWIRTVVELS
jgi:hypothetical protein